MGGSILARARIKARLTQRELAERTGVAQPTIARIERGRAAPQLGTLERLLAACGYALELAPRLGRGVDRSALRELLGLTPEERLRRAVAEARNLDRLLVPRQ